MTNATLPPRTSDIPPRTSDFQRLPADAAQAPRVAPSAEVRAYQPSSEARAYQPHTRAGQAVRLDQARYWVGAVFTAAVAALAGIVGMVVAHGIAHVPVLVPDGGTLTAAHALTYGLAAAGLALLGAGLYDGMLQVAPRPTVYYAWIASLLTLLAVLVPFTTSAGLHSQIALAGMNLLVGLAITILVPVAAENARVRA